MGIVRVWLARWRWVLWVVAAALVAILTLLVRRLFAGAEEGPQVWAPPVDLQEKADQAWEQAEIVRARVKIQTQQQLQQLDEVGRIADGGERRRRLAELLRTL